MIAAFWGKQELDNKDRRQEIEDCLAEHGLKPRQRMWVKEETSSTQSKVHVKRLRSIIESLGPVFSLFGRYLGTRVDLFPISVCLELLEIPDVTEPMDHDTVQSIIKQEWGQKSASVLLSFDPSPRSSRLVYQTHFGRFMDGTPVRIQLINPVFPKLVERDSPLLYLLQPAFLSVSAIGFRIKAVIADFMRFLPLYLDRPTDYNGMMALADDATQFNELAVPPFMPDLSTSLIRTIERLPGWSLDELMPASPDKYVGSHEDEMPKNLDLGISDVARRTCYVWLRQALFGSQYPVEIRPDDLSILPTHKIVFHDGIFTSLPSISQDHIWQYLQATAGQDPDTAFDYLMQEMENRESFEDESELRVRFRQVVPFRDGPWSLSDSGDSLAEHVFVHLRMIREYGLQPRVHLMDFYRGLFTLVAITKKLVPEQDALREGLDELRLKMGYEQIREMMDLNVWQDTFSKYAMSVIELPKKLDEVLERVSGDGINSGQKSSSGRSSSAGQKSRSAKIIGILCMMGAMVLVYNHLIGTIDEDLWVTRTVAIILLMLGISALGLIRKT
jgi:predicted unusual protein kinase regulating ubiquinone biosynthesis (AarF/ABC1/UbiB family)